MTTSSDPHRGDTAAPIRRAALRAAAVCGVLALGTLVAGCTTSLLPKAPQQATLYALNDVPAVPAAAPRAAGTARPTLIVNPPRAAAGFDTAHIVYTRSAHQVDYYAFSQWVDTPAQMLAPLIVRAIEQGGAFGAVLLAPTAAAAPLRMDTELIRLQQDFSTSPSQARFTLRAVLLESSTRRVLAVREFDASVPAPSEDAPGGVAAANLAVQRVLGELASFVAAAAVPG